MSARRFLYVEHHPVFGGPHNRAIVLAEPLRANGWETIAVLPDEPGTAAERYRAAGLRVEVVPLCRLRRSLSQSARAAVRFPGDVSRLRRLIRRERAELVVVAGLESPHGILAARLEGTAAVWQIVSTRPPRLYAHIMSPFARRYADVVMTTGTIVADAHPGIRRLGARWVPFFSPVDTGRFSPSSERRPTARAALSLPQDALVIGTVGNVNPQKGHQTFIRAAADIRRVFPDARFVILGEESRDHARYRDALLAEAARLGLARGDGLVVHAPGPDVAELAGAIDVFWSTSVPRSEGVPTSVMEAMALGLPVVATDVGGVSELVQHGETGLLVPPLAPEQLARATLPLITDQTLRRQLGNAARAFAVERCGVERSLERHLVAFETALRHAALRSQARRERPNSGAAVRNDAE